jgi:hypothetical protein
VATVSDDVRRAEEYLRLATEHRDDVRAQQRMLWMVLAALAVPLAALLVLGAVAVAVGLVVMAS